MKLGGIGILEIDGERIGIRPTRIDYDSNGAVIEGEILNIFRKSNYLARKNNRIKKVIFNAPATIVIWTDGTKTVVKCQEGDIYDSEKGLAMCIAKKYLGNKGNFNEVFKQWIPEDIFVEKMRLELDRFCNNRLCTNCILSSFNSTNNCNFLSSYHGIYALSDDKIREAYNIAFERKTEPSITLPTIPEGFKEG